MAFSQRTSSSRLYVLLPVAAYAILVGACTVAPQSKVTQPPAVAAAQPATTPTPPSAPQGASTPAPKSAPAPKAKAEVGKDYPYFFEAAKKFKDEALVGQLATISMKGPGQEGYMDINRKKKIFGRCQSGTGKYNTGKVTGTYVGTSGFEDDSGFFTIVLKDCRAS